MCLSIKEDWSWSGFVLFVYQRLLSFYSRFGGWHAVCKFYHVWLCDENYTESVEKDNDVKYKIRQANMAHDDWCKAIILQNCTTFRITESQRRSVCWSLSLMTICAHRAYRKGAFIRECSAQIKNYLCLG